MRRKHSAAIARASGAARRAAIAPATRAVLAAVALMIPAAAAAQDPGAMKIRGIASLMYAYSFQDTRLGGPAFNNGKGVDFRAGFQPGDWLAFTVGYQWQTGGASDPADNYDTHFFPVGVRVYAPVLGERLHFFGEGAIGIFISRLSGNFGNESNERASAIQAGGGVEVDLLDNWSGVLDVNYTKGLGSAEDYRAKVIGFGIVYRWDL